MAGTFVAYPSLGGSGGSGGLSSISFSIGVLDGGAANQNGASVSSNSIFLQSAGAIFPGLVNSASQTFSGVKTFSSAPNFSSLTASAFLKLDGSKNVSVASISLTNDVTGNLPLSQTQGSLSLTTQVVGILPAANLPPLSGITGSVSLTTQVSGRLPEANMSSTSAAYLIGTLDGATVSTNGAVIGSSSLFMQSASSAFPGLMNTTGQRFSGLKTFTAVGINDVSSTAALYVKSSSLGLNTMTIQGLSGQTSLGLNIIDNSGNPKVVYDFNAGALRLFVNAQEAAECNFDNRATVVTGATSTGSAARFNFICADQSAVTAGRGGGIAFGATVTGTTTVTEYGYVWATKNNANAGDDDGTLHFASRNNATGKAQRGIDIDQNGNSTFFGNVQLAGALNGQVNISAGSSIATYTVTMPSAQAVGSVTVLSNSGGNLSWLVTQGTNVQVLSSGSGTFTPPSGWQTLKVTVIGGGGQGGGAGSSAASSAAAGGGGGGGTALKWINVSSNSGQTFAYIVGDGGNGSIGSTTGAIGTSSVFGTVLAFGGSGGTFSATGTTPGIGGNGGVGGSSLNGDVGIKGGGGTYGLIVSATSAVCGVGGGSVYGHNQPPTINTSAGGNTGQIYGGGGGGGIQVNNGGVQLGGFGAPGVIVVETFFA